jgi:hypothetical protein
MSCNNCPNAHTFGLIMNADGTMIADVNFANRTPLELKMDCMLDKLDRIIELLETKVI